MTTERRLELPLADVGETELTMANIVTLPAQYGPPTDSNTPKAVVLGGNNDLSGGVSLREVIAGSKRGRGAHEVGVTRGMWAVHVGSLRAGRAVRRSER
jgi:hypothetical protein